MCLIWQLTPPTLPFPLPLGDQPAMYPIVKENNVLTRSSLN